MEPIHPKGCGRDSEIFPIKSYVIATGGYNYYFQVARKVDADSKSPKAK